MSSLFYHYQRSMFTFYLNRNQFFSPTQTQQYTLTRGERERESGFVFFFMWWEGLWDKGCDATPVEFSLDQSCSQRQHNDEHRWMPAPTLETCTAATAPRRFPAQEPLIGIPGWRCCLPFSQLTWDQEGGKKKKNKQGSDWNSGGWENGEGALKWICGLWEGLKHQPLVFLLSSAVVADGFVWSLGQLLLSRMADCDTPALGLPAQQGNSLR